jgi:hypothetical protein
MISLGQSISMFYFCYITHNSVASKCAQISLANCRIPHCIIDVEFSNVTMQNSTSVVSFLECRIPQYQFCFFDRIILSDPERWRHHPIWCPNDQSLIPLCNTKPRPLKHFLSHFPVVFSRSVLWNRTGTTLLNTTSLWNSTVSRTEMTL